MEPAATKCHEIDFGIVLRAEFKGFFEERLHALPASRMFGFHRALLVETFLHGCTHCAMGVIRGKGRVRVIGSIGVALSTKHRT